MAQKLLGHFPNLVAQAALFQAVMNHLIYPCKCTPAYCSSRLNLPRLGTSKPHLLLLQTGDPFTNQTRNKQCCCAVQNKFARVS